MCTIALLCVGEHHCAAAAFLLLVRLTVASQNVLDA